MENILAEDIRIQGRAIPLAEDEIIRPDIDGLLQMTG
jgi:hypothetical protein